MNILKSAAFLFILLIIAVSCEDGINEIVIPDNPTDPDNRENYLDPKLLLDEAFPSVISAAEFSFSWHYDTSGYDGQADPEMIEDLYTRIAYGIKGRERLFSDWKLGLTDYTIYPDQTLLNEVFELIIESSWKPGEDTAHIEQLAFESGVDILGNNTAAVFRPAHIFAEPGRQYLIELYVHNLPLGNWTAAEMIFVNDGDAALTNFSSSYQWRLDGQTVTFGNPEAVNEINLLSFGMEPIYDYDQILRLQNIRFLQGVGGDGDEFIAEPAVLHIQY